MKAEVEIEYIAIQFPVKTQKEFDRLVEFMNKNKDLKPFQVGVGLLVEDE